MLRSFIVLVLLFPSLATAQQSQGGLADNAKRAYEILFTKPVRLSVASIAPGSGVPVGLGFKPKPWRSGTLFKIVEARAAVSQHKYWAVDGSVAFQGVGEREWRLEPYGTFRSMKRLNYFGVGNDTLADERATFSMLDRRAGGYGYFRPVGWLALGARGEGLSARTSSGQDPDVPSIEVMFDPSQRPGFGESTNFFHAVGFINLNYPYSRSEMPRRGGDYYISLGTYHDLSETNHSFSRFEIEGRERFTVFGSDRGLTIHGRLSSSSRSADNSVPFYLMDTLGGADNLRGFKESIIGGDEATSTLRSFESFRFRDLATVLLQVDFRQRIWSQVFATAFVDWATVAPTVDALSLSDGHYGIGLGLSVYRTSALALRIEVGAWGGESHPHYITTGRGLQF